MSSVPTSVCESKRCAKSVVGHYCFSLETKLQNKLRALFLTLECRAILNDSLCIKCDLYDTCSVFPSPCIILVSRAVFVIV